VVCLDNQYPGKNHGTSLRKNLYLFQNETIKKSWFFQCRLNVIHLINWVQVVFRLSGGGVIFGSSDTVTLFLNLQNEITHKNLLLFINIHWNIAYTGKNHGKNHGKIMGKIMGKICIFPKIFPFISQNGRINLYFL